MENKRNKQHGSPCSQYSDYELLSFLEENNFKPTYKNLSILKEGLENGDIEMTPEKLDAEIPENNLPKEKECGVETKDVPDKGEKEEIEDTAGKVLFNIGSACKNKHCFDESSTRHIETLLSSYLIEDCGMSDKEYATLTEDVKIDSVKEMAISLLKSVEEKIINIDTASADRSRGDIKQVRELQTMQDVISHLETIIDRSEDGDASVSKAIKIVIKAILCINQYSSVFKDAYRNKKTLLILKYQSLILSLISSISFIISVALEYDENGVKLKKSINEDLLNFAPIVSLKKFVDSVESGEFKIVIKDTTTLREYFLEVPVSKMSCVLEALEYIPMIVDGVKNIYDNLAANSSKIVNFLYKAAGILVLIFSLRDTFYTMFRMKTKVSDMVSNLQNFVDLNDGSGSSIFGKLIQFTNKYKVDAENNSEIARREIEDENKKLLGQVKAIQSMTPTDEPEVINAPKATTSQSAIDTFGFDF